MLEVVILTVAPDLAKDEFDALMRFVSPEKQERINRFKFYKDAQNALLGDILARTEICRTTGLSNKELQFFTNKYGKPFLSGHPRIHFNISHSGAYVGCAIDDQPVGIDAELVKPIDLKIAERFFAPDETGYILSASEDSRAERFFQVWTKKESRIKWEGKGLSKPLPSFSVFDPVELEKLVYHMVFRNDEAICHVCSASRGTPAVRVIDTAALMRFV